MKKITKEQAYILSLFLIIVASIILFLYPEIVKYPYSYTSVEEKKNLITQGNSQLTSNESEIKNLIKQKDNKKEEGNEINNKALKLKKNINEKDFELDIPSLLISLEQQSYKNDVKLSIHYNEIKLVESDQTMPEDPSDKITEDKSDENSESAKGTEVAKDDQENKDSEEKEDEKTIGGKSVEDKENEEKDGEQKEKEISFSQEEIEKGVLKIEGMNTTIIPIVLEGSYSSVRSYIKYLDEIGMIEPSSVELVSEGKKVTAKIVLNVFHGEVL